MARIRIVTYQLIRINVFLLDVKPLCSQAQLRGLELQIGVLATICQGVDINPIYSPSRHFVIEDTRVRSTDVRLETAVQDSDLTPVHIERLDVLMGDTGTETGLLQRRAHGTHCGLGRQTGQV